MRSSSPDPAREHAGRTPERSAWPPHASGLPALLLLCLSLALTLVTACPAAALVRFDFEQKYFRHPGRQVWDFSITRPDSLYHIFYHSILETTPSATQADTIWHAVSPDLLHWQADGEVRLDGNSTTTDLVRPNAPGSQFIRLGAPQP